ncbi:hypothetical protein CYL18_07005 [Pradoshia eiseniae]|uniref:DUF4240 domain-containing protein n=2 Tax=Pradoshia eiseniae TaxID=2064768 RepID=A0A2S7N0T7_9BACI|nr:hypothetical protein CYL18_07005 [Pradoshia eiseniae]
MGVEMGKETSNNTVSIGDVFAVRLPNGHYGAIRVADRADNSCLIVTTPYISADIPFIDNELLSGILLQNRFFYNNHKAKIWVEGKKPKEVIFIGNIPVSDTKQKIICNTFGAQWDGSIGMEAYLEWRWKYDREKFVEEIQEEENKIDEEHKKIQKPKKMMKDETFWLIISLLNSDEKTGEEDILEPAVNALAKMEIKDIKEFEEALANKLYLLDTMEHAKNIGKHSYKEEAQEFFSADLFLYIRCFIIAKGKENFDLTVENPQNISEVNSFEPLLSLASKAYTRKTGNEFAYISGYDYETFSNIEGWK